MTIAQTAPTRPSPTRRVVVLSGAMTVALIPGCATAWVVIGPSGLAAPVAAAAACWIGGLAAVVGEERLGSRQRVPAAMLAGTGLRLAPPVALALAARLDLGGLWEAGLPYYLGAFYIVVLGTETATHLALRQPNPRHRLPP